MLLHSAAEGDISQRLLDAALKAQRTEITEYHVYRGLSVSSGSPRNKEILKQIANDELRHYTFWKSRTGTNMVPSRRKVWLHTVLARIFGITFAMKLMEIGEGKAQAIYGDLEQDIPGLREVIDDEDKHEALLVDLVDEDRLNYVSSILKGLNSAVVELAGALAGLTLVFHDSHLIAVAGLVSGVAMTMGLVGTDYLGARTDSLFRHERIDGFRHYLKGPIYSGATALVVAFFLTMPFLVFTNKFVSLGTAMAIALTAIFLFNFYVSVTRSVSFFVKAREMLVISVGTAGLAFVGGYLIRLFLAGMDKIR